MGKMSSLILPSCLEVCLNSSIFIRAIRGVVVAPDKAEVEGSNPKLIFFSLSFILVITNSAHTKKHILGLENKLCLHLCLLNIYTQINSLSSHFVWGEGWATS